jgi:SAM-dependent methyltransferase
MLACRCIPTACRELNQIHGAPFGRTLYRWTSEMPVGLRFIDSTIFKVMPALRGPFAFQPNNATREAEYPWAFHATPIMSGLKVLEIGGSLSGFQFVLDRAGCQVVNVDPGMEAHGRGWPVDATSIAQLNRMFGTSVELYNGFLSAAPFARDTFDRIFSISVIEHVPLEESPALMARAYELLKPGGYFVMTLDLFLNLKPFTSRESNEFGTNVSVRTLAESAPFELIEGDRTELFGYPEFDADRILSNLDALMVGMYPAIPQLVVLRKPIPLGRDQSAGGPKPDETMSPTRIVA